MGGVWNDAVGPTSAGKGRGTMRGRPFTLIYIAFIAMIALMIGASWLLP